MKLAKETAGSQRWKQRPARWAVLFCLLLVAIMAAAQALHFHANEFSNHENCLICQVAHAPKAAAIILLLAVTLACVAYMKSAAIPVAQPSVRGFSLFCRPPPTV